MNITFKHAKKIAELLRERKETISVAESSVGGLLSASLLAVPGASDYYMGGTVVYTMRARRKLLGLSKEILDTQEPLTETYVSLLAKAIREQLRSDWAIAELGATGPGVGGEPDRLERSPDQIQRERQRPLPPERSHRPPLHRNEVPARHASVPLRSASRSEADPRIGVR